jgi:hypothetical protein
MMFTDEEKAELAKLLHDTMAPQIAQGVGQLMQAFLERAGRVEKLRTFIALLPAGRESSVAPSTHRLMQRVATELGYWPFNGVNIAGLYDRACAELERELYGEGAPPPAPKGDIWE